MQYKKHGREKKNNSKENVDANQKSQYIKQTNRSVQLTEQKIVTTPLLRLIVDVTAYVGPVPLVGYKTLAPVRFAESPSLNTQKKKKIVQN